MGLVGEMVVDGEEVGGGSGGVGEYCGWGGEVGGGGG